MRHVLYLGVKNECSWNNVKKFTFEENHKKVSGSRFEQNTSIKAASRKLRRMKYKLADSAVGVAQNEFPQPILVPTAARFFAWKNSCVVFIVVLVQASLSTCWPMTEVGVVLEWSVPLHTDSRQTEPDPLLPRKPRQVRNIRQQSPSCICPYYFDLWTQDIF